LESSEVQSFYKASLNKDTTEKKWMLKSTYTGNLRRETQRATMFTLFTRPEVVLPTYMASAFGLDKEFL
jgi:hypothetical protein